MTAINLLVSVAFQRDSRVPLYFTTLWAVVQKPGSSSAHQSSPVSFLCSMSIGPVELFYFSETACAPQLPLAPLWINVELSHELGD